MADAPQKIWLQHGDPYEPYDENTWSEHKTDEAPAETRYVRADLMRRWHRIDDPEYPAPKDGTVFLGYEAPHVETMLWSEYQQRWVVPNVYGPEGWADPTHWMPLPAPPKAD